MEIKSSEYNYDSNINSEQQMINSSSSEIQLLQNLQNGRNSGLLPLLNNTCPVSSKLTSEILATCPIGSRMPYLNTHAPHHNCYCQQSSVVKDNCHLTKESKAIQTQIFPSSGIIHTKLNPRKQRENLRKQVSFELRSLKQKEPVISVRSRLLGEKHNEEQNRHLSDIELLRQVYDELRHKISQTSQDQTTVNKMKITKRISWKECFLGERMRRWSLWFIITFLAAMTIRDITLLPRFLTIQKQPGYPNDIPTERPLQLVIEYMEYPKQSNMNIMFNESMHMPNITFCMSKQQAWSHFTLNSSGSAEDWDVEIQKELDKLDSRKKFLDEAWNYRLVIEAYEVIATLNSMERETTAQGSARSIDFFRTHPKLQAKRTMVKAWLNEIKRRDVTFEELTQKVGLETIKYSVRRFQRTTFNESLKIRTKFRTSWISTMQFCFQPWFDPDSYFEIKDQGNFFTMLLSHNADNLEGVNIACMSVDFHGRPSSLSRFMEGQGRARDGFNDDLCLGMRHEVTVDVRARYVMLENDDNGTACRNAIKEESEFDCRSRCRMEMIRNMCKCTPPTLSYLVRNKDEYNKSPICDYEKCKIDVKNNTYSDHQCTRKCYRSCDQITYEVSHTQHGKMFHRDFTIINLNWGSFEYLTLSQYWVWSMPTFIAALGGSMGAWLGLSILSLIQVNTSYI
uniref:Uncharacterized protein n=1 Tax=Setaria digitata TaxID=48799 RepID=A0A915PVE6_9BILA